mmetsp:Transcript_22345/g.56176  ORF Transcript_22345/g.56176 Transcript_22345/m.56176 type:complete len:212 (+) Transcript_22345:123-758(+)
MPNTATRPAQPRGTTRSATHSGTPLQQGSSAGREGSSTSTTATANPAIGAPRGAMLAVSAAGGVPRPPSPAGVTSKAVQSAAASVAPYRLSAVQRGGASAASTAAGSPAGSGSPLNTRWRSAGSAGSPGGSLGSGGTARSSAEATEGTSTRWLTPWAAAAQRKAAGPEPRPRGGRTASCTPGVSSGAKTCQSASTNVGADVQPTTSPRRRG